MKQKLLTLLCALMATITASAYDFSCKYDNITLSFNILTGTTCSVAKWSTYSDCNVDIPETVTYNGQTYTVTSIANSAFEGCSYMKSVTIPNSVTSIGNSAFYNCTDLTNVTIPNSVRTIDQYSFARCSNLTSVTIGNSLTSIGKYAFDECSSLTQVYISDLVAWCKISTDYYVPPFYRDYNLYLNGERVTDLVIPDAVTSIKRWTFYKCRGLTSVTISDSVNYIGETAFSSCSELTSVTIGNSVTSIESSAFRNCAGLKSITVYNSNPSKISLGYYIFTGVPTSTCTLYVPRGSKQLYAAANQWKDFTNIEEFTLSTKVGLTYEYTDYTHTAYKVSGFTNELPADVIIPAEYNGLPVIAIGNGAFSGCESLASIEIPSSVTSIGTGAFQGCANLMSFMGKFASEDNRCLIIDGALVSFAPCGLTSYSIPESVTSIGEKAFHECGSLTSIEIPNSVTSIGNYAFYSCSSLTSIEIPNSVTSIGNYAFYDCSSLASIEIPNSVTSIRSCTFQSCSSLTSVVIPNSVTTIGAWAFSSCSSLTSIEIPNSVTSIGRSTFSGCSSLTSVEIPNSVTSIGDDAFQSCSSLTSIEIPNSVTSIGDYTFSYCSRLTSIEIPNSVTSIGDFAFYDCSSLTSIEIPNSVTSIGNYAFYDCSSLASIEIPNSVTSIGNSAFYSCSSLTSIEIPNSVTSIGNNAFYYCSNLASLTVDNEAPANISLGSDVFDSVLTSTCTLYVPKGSKALYAAADQWRDFTNIEEVFYGITLTDGEVYDATENQIDVDIDYTRNFTDTYWQPLYVPFNMSYEEWSEYADVAEVHNVRGYDTDDDGVIDDVEIEFNMISSGEIVPNIPYVIKAKNTGEVTFECKGKTLLAAPAKEGSVECSSTKMTYSLHGVYQPKTDMFSTGAYQLRDNAFHQATSDETVLAPNRFYLLATPKTGGYKPTSAPKMIKILVNGNGTTTSVEEVGVDTQKDDTYYDLMGRRVVYPTRGIYIQNGRKVFVK